MDFYSWTQVLKNYCISLFSIKIFNAKISSAWAGKNSISVLFFIWGWGVWSLYHGSNAKHRAKEKWDLFANKTLIHSDCHWEFCWLRLWGLACPVASYQAWAHEALAGPASQAPWTSHLGVLPVLGIVPGPRKGTPLLLCSRTTEPAQWTLFHDWETFLVSATLNFYRRP